MMMSRMAVLALCLLILPFSAAAEDALPPPQIDEQAKRVRVSGKIARQNIYAQLKGAIEYVACVPGGKEYESVLVCHVDPVALHAALIKVGFKPGAAAHEEGERYFLPQGAKLKLQVEYNDGKQIKTVPVETFILDTVTGKPMQEVGWAFTGSRESKDPQTGKTVLEVAVVRNLISLHHKDPTVLIQNPLKDGQNDSRYKSNAEALPPEGTAVTLIIEEAPLIKQAIPAGFKRIHLQVVGKVQGVGFREFTQRTARQLGMQGWVRNLASGDVELEAQGPEDKVKEFEEKVRKGPRGAQIQEVKTLPAGEDSIGEFEIRETQ